MNPKIDDFIERQSKYNFSCIVEEEIDFEGLCIVFFHNAAKNTPAALPGIIKALKDDGYKIVPVSELIYKDNYTIDHTGKQIKK